MSRVLAVYPHSRSACVRSGGALTLHVVSVAILCVHSALPSLDGARTKMMMNRTLAAAMACHWWIKNDSRRSLMLSLSLTYALTRSLRLDVATLLMLSIPAITIWLEFREIYYFYRYSFVVSRVINNASMMRIFRSFRHQTRLLVVLKIILTHT